MAISLSEYTESVKKLMLISEENKQITSLMFSFANHSGYIPGDPFDRVVIEVLIMIMKASKYEISRNMFERKNGEVLLIEQWKKISEIERSILNAENFLRKHPENQISLKAISEENVRQSSAIATNLFGMGHCIGKNVDDAIAGYRVKCRTDKGKDE